MGKTHLAIIFGAIFSYLLLGGIGYYIGYSAAWDSYRQKPKIGAEPLDIKLVIVVKEIKPGEEIKADSIEERRQVMPNVALDSYGFASEVLGRKPKWVMHKGEYISHHDLQPVIKDTGNG